jgi:hypothetical protein
MFAMIMCGQTVMSKESKCPDLSGVYNFFGKAADPTGTASLSELRFDEKAMAMTVRTIVQPQTVILTHDVTTGVLSADVLGAGIDERFVLMSAKLPLQATFICQLGGWKMDVVKIGSGGGGRSSETRQIAILHLLPEGLIVDGTRTITTGTFSRQTLVRTWKVLFERKQAQ